jgi:hypothetical protein|tara:strand:- start:222 stop:464 length:243 start_codon:yes stop_codon:yes gene_type:complete
MVQLKRGDLVRILGRKPKGLGVVMDCIIGVGDFTDDYYYIVWIIVPGDVQLGHKGWYSREFLNQLKKSENNPLQSQIDLV